MSPFRAALVLVLAGLLGRPAAAQSQYFAMAPTRYHVVFVGTDGSGSALVGIDRSVPLHFFLPNVGRTSHVDAAAVLVGARRAGGKTELRYRVTALDLTVSRAPWNGGLRLLSYDRSGSRDVVADWLAVQVGPGARVRIGVLDIEPRIELTGAFASRRTGRVLFDELPESADQGATGVAGSVAAAATVTLSDGAHLEARVGLERFSAGHRPEHRFAGAAMHVTVATRFEAVVRAGLERASVGGISSDLLFAGFGLRFTPSAQAY